MMPALPPQTGAFARPIRTSPDSQFASMVRDVLGPLGAELPLYPWRIAAASLPPEDLGRWRELATRYEDAGLHTQAAERLALVEVRRAKSGAQT